jgi:hypothetical protein
MRYKNYLAENNMSPLNTHMYGGIPDGGEYRSNTEYEIGHQAFVEAAHCILGSLGKMNRGSMVESGHIHEELGIMIKVMKEYSRSLYTERLKEYYDEGGKSQQYAENTYNNLQTVSEKLLYTAKKFKAQLLKYQPEGEIKDVAIACYDAIIHLAEQAQWTTPKDWYMNVFTYSTLEGDIRLLKARIDKLFKV